MARIGTAHFRSLAHARTYYATYGHSAQDVDRKLGSGEFHIGPPKLSPGERFIWDDDGRAIIINGQA